MTTCADCNNFDAYCKFLVDSRLKEKFAVSPSQTKCRYDESKFAPKFDVARRPIPAKKVTTKKRKAA